jgi:hypothetical protein
MLLCIWHLFLHLILLIIIIWILCLWLILILLFSKSLFILFIIFIVFFIVKHSWYLIPVFLQAASILVFEYILSMLILINIFIRRTLEKWIRCIWKNILRFFIIIIFLSKRISSLGTCHTGISVVLNWNNIWLSYIKSRLIFCHFYILCKLCTFSNFWIVWSPQFMVILVRISLALIILFYLIWL